MSSSYFSRLRKAVQHRIHGSTTGREVLLGRGKLLFGNSRFFHSKPFSGLTDLQVLLRRGIIFVACSDSLLVNQRKNLSVVGALSRTFSIPSVSGPSLQACAYHIDRTLSEPSVFSNDSKPEKAAISACGPRAVFDDHHLDNLTPRHVHLSASIKDSINGNRSFYSSRRGSTSLENPEQLIHDAAKTGSNSNPYVLSGLRNFHSSLSACYSAGTAPDMSFDNCALEEQLTGSSVSSEQKIQPGRTLKLLSGSCYLPHPDKEETGGEDAHFICVDGQAIGVADGVGGWADHGVDAGLYARELMSNSLTAVLEEPKGAVNPARVLEKAHFSTKAKGSSTACIIALTDQGLQAINLGDSGFIVIREGCTVFRSPVQQHNFNFTYQLESGNSGDLPSSGQVFTIPVAPGDVIIAGTDGLFDNLYNNEVIAVAVHATRANLGPQVTAQKVAALARQRAQDKNRQTPFSTAAQDAGFRYYGGKLDDITVVVSYITSK